MSNTWMHCNSCYCTPTAATTRRFFFGSCGHIVCCSCHENAPSQPSKKCSVCGKEAEFALIGVELKPELQLLFRDPSEIASNMMTQLRRALDFQDKNRKNLMQHQMTKNEKMMQFAQELRLEVQKSVAKERKIAEESKLMQIEWERMQKKCRDMEEKLEKLRAEAQFKGSTSDSGCSSGLEISLDSVTSTQQSFFTSTPIERSPETEKQDDLEQERPRTPSFFIEGKRKRLSPILAKDDDEPRAKVMRTDAGGDAQQESDDNEEEEKTL